MASKAFQLTSSIECMHRQYKYLCTLLVFMLILTGCSGQKLELYDDGIIQIQLDEENFIMHDTLPDEGSLQLSMDGEDIVICINYTTALTGTCEQVLLDMKDSLSLGYRVSGYSVRQGSNGEKKCTEASYTLINSDGQSVYAKEKVFTRGGFDAITVWYLAYEYVDEDNKALFDKVYASIDWSPNSENAANRIRGNNSNDTTENKETGFEF